MKRIFYSLLVAAMLPGIAVAQKKVLLNEDFSGVAVNYDDHYADLTLDGWSQSGTPSGLDMPMRWCVYATGKSDAPDNVAYIDRKYTYDGTSFAGTLLTPVLDLDGTYELSYQWKSSAVALDSSHPYDFQVKVVEEGADVASAPVVWDFLNPDMLLESGVAPNAYGQLWTGWEFYISKIDLSKWKGKKVRVAFCYEGHTNRANSIFLDNVKVEQFEAATTPVASLSDYSWNFGDVYIGSKVYSNIFTLTNTGTGTLEISGADAPAGFGVAFAKELADIKLRKNESVQFQLSYQPALTSATEGTVTLRGNFPDATLNVRAAKKMVPQGGAFEGFEGEEFPPAGWTASKWTASRGGIEGDKAANPNAYYMEANYLQSPRIDASKSAATIEFSYADIYNGEETGSDCQVQLKFSKDGGASWEVVDTYDYNDPYNEIVRKSYSRDAQSDNCYWRWEWELTYYDSEYGAEASLFYLDAVVLNNVYGAGGLPAAAELVGPADGATGIHARNAVLSWGAAQFADGYKLYVGTDDACTSLVDGVDLGNTLTYTLPALAYSTTYKWRVEPYNAHGTAEGAATWSFTTIADPTVTALPWSEGFNGDFPPAGWNVYGEGSTHWDDNSIEPYEGTASAMANPRDPGKTCTMETPDIVLPADAPAYITFFWGDGVAVTLEKPASGYADNTTKGSDGISDMSFEIYAGGKWTPLALLSDKNNPYWIRERIDLTDYAGQTVAFRWVYTYYSYLHARGACVDGITVELQADEKLSFNADGWNAGKLNHDQSMTSREVFTLINDGSTAATIASANFGSANFATSLKAGDVIESGKSLAFTVTAIGNDANGTVDDVLTVTSASGGKAEFAVKAEVLPDDTLYFGFEDSENGDLAVDGLTFVDVDNVNTISLALVDYPHRGDKMAFMVINSSLTDWPNPYPNTGKQCLVTFGAYNSGMQEDWVISPRMKATAQSSFDFWGRNYEHKDQMGGGAVFGCGMATVMVSESDDPADRSAYKEIKTYSLVFPVKDEYGQCSTDLSAYAGKQIYVALRHKSTDGLAYLYDDFQYNKFDSFDFSGVENVAVGADGVALAANVVSETLRVLGTDAASIHVVAMSGAVVAEACGTEIAVGHLPAGIYLAVVDTADGQKAFRFIKR